MRTHRIMTHADAAKLAGVLVDLPLPLTVTVGEGGKRSLQQNALLHKWYGQIASHKGDVTAMDVKGQCHVAYGVPIRLRDPVFARVWQSMFAGLTYEQQCFLFSRGILAMTREMGVKELSEYMDAMARDYRTEGVFLTDPEAQKYEGAA